MYETVDVLHHQLAAQADGVLEVRSRHVPVGVVAVATLQPQRHHGKQQLDDGEDAEPRTWREEKQLGGMCRRVCLFGETAVRHPPVSQHMSVCYLVQW